VVVSRIRMGYTRLTEAYRLDNSPQPQFQICQTSISVEIDQGFLEENEEKAIRYLKNIGLYHEI
jgi:hypothetical protein